MVPDSSVGIFQSAFSRKATKSSVWITFLLGVSVIYRRCLKIQIRWALPIIVIGGLLGWLWVGKSTIWLVASLILALSACVQILTYAHRAALRALGESRQEALVRFVDRGATAVGIVLAASLFGAHPIALALATFLGPIGAMIIAIWLGENRLSIVTEDGFELDLNNLKENLKLDKEEILNNFFKKEYFCYMNAFCSWNTILFHKFHIYLISFNVNV